MASAGATDTAPLRDGRRSTLPRGHWPGVLINLRGLGALNNTCTLIYSYYGKLEAGKNEPRADGACTFNRIVYGIWFALIFSSTIIRLYGLILMLRARKFLKRKLLEKI